jgi:hypothetical protein
MKFKTVYIAALFLLPFVLSNCSPQIPKAPTELDPSLLISLDSASVRNHLMVISHDSLEGRAPGTVGEQRTIRYIKGVFEKAGLEPAFSGSFTQDVPLIATKVSGTPQLSFSHEDGTRQDMTFVNDYRVFTDSEQSEIQTSGEVVFVGHGITAPEFEWDDYAGVDVTGKVVMVFDGEPMATETEPNLFKADTLTYYGRFTFKIEEARRRGASGIIIIENPVFFARNRMRATTEQIQLTSQPDGLLDVKVYLSNEAAGNLARKQGSTLEEWRSLAGQRGFTAQTLPFTMESNTSYDIRRINGQNVGAILRGYERPNEIVLFTAHHDHLGIGIPDAKGDSIYNGAVDNASGTATVLMLAEAFAKMPYKPKRSIMFLTVTAEESGLLGAYYYSYNPAFPLAQTVANINIDCTNMFGPTYDITAVGPEYSELGNLLREKATLESMELVPFPNIAGGIFFRSDQLPFAQGGVPALYLLSGNQYHEGYQEFVASKSAAYSGSYHQPSDNFDPEWMMEGTLQQARVAFRMAYQLANTNTWPQWVEGSEFESIRKSTDNLRK